MLPTDGSELLFVEALDTLKEDEAQEEQWPCFSSNLTSPYSFFVTHRQGVYFFSTHYRVEKLSKELYSDDTKGSKFRIEVLNEGPGTFREKVIRFEEEAEVDPQCLSSACVVLLDPEIGLLLLTTDDRQPYAVMFDTPTVARQDFDTYRTFDGSPEDATLLTTSPVRSGYSAPLPFWSQSSLPTFLDRHAESRHKKMLKEEIRLSGLTLDLMTQAHRILSLETYQLGVAAADLFRRCDRLQTELRDQIKRANEAAVRTDDIVGAEIEDYYTPSQTSGRADIEKRLEKAKERRKHLSTRYEKLREKVGKLGGKDLSEREQQWVSEIDKLSTSILGDEEKGATSAREPWERLKEVRNAANFSLAHRLIPRPT